MSDYSRKIVLLGWAASTHLQKWARGLRGRGWQVKVLTPDNYALTDIETIKIPGGKRYYWRGSSFVSKALREFKPDLFHVHYVGGFGWLGMRSGFRPVIMSAWGADVIDLPKNPLLRYIISRILQSADHVTTTSPLLKEACLRLAPHIGSHLTVIPFGVEIPEQTTTYPQGSFRICYIKKHEYKYGPELLLDAVLRLLDDGLDIELTMAGEGKLTGQLRQKVERAGQSDRIRFPGFVDHSQIYDLLGCHNLMVMPSVQESESFGVAAVEASACSRPVIASRIGGVPDVIQEGKTGLLVPPGDSLALAEAIRKLYLERDLSEKLGMEGRKYVAAHYSWDVSLNQMIEVYEKTIRQYQKNTPV